MIGAGIIYATEDTMPETQTVETKNILKSKTFWFNILGGVASTVLTSVPDEYKLIAMAGGNVLLRLITKQPVNVLPQ